MGGSDRLSVEKIYAIVLATAFLVFAFHFLWGVHPVAGVGLIVVYVGAVVSARVRGDTITEAFITNLVIGVLLFGVGLFGWWLLVGRHASVSPLRVEVDELIHELEGAGVSTKLDAASNLVTCASIPDSAPLELRRRCALLEALSALQAGVVRFEPSTSMVLGTSELVTAEIEPQPGPHRPPLPGRFVGEPIRYGVETTACLVGSEAFEIETLTGRVAPDDPRNCATQAVGGSVEWTWRVTPTLAGKRHLDLAIYPLVRLGEDEVLPGPTAVIGHVVRIHVDASSFRRWLELNWRWLIATILGGGGAAGLYFAFRSRRQARSVATPPTVRATGFAIPEAPAEAVAGDQRPGPTETPATTADGDSG